MRDAEAFCEWMSRHKLSIRGAARVLRCSKVSVTKWRKSDPPFQVLATCALFSQGLQPIGERSFDHG